MLGFMTILTICGGLLFMGALLINGFYVSAVLYLIILAPMFLAAQQTTLFAIDNLIEVVAGIVLAVSVGALVTFAGETVEEGEDLE